MDASGCGPAALSRKRSDFITEPRAATFPRLSYWSVAVAPATSSVMGEHVAQQNIERDRTNRKRPSKQTAAETAIGHKLLEIIVYGRTCRVGGKLSVDDLVESSEVGDWKMPDFKMAWNLCCFPRLADRRGRYADANRGRAGGGLIGSDADKRPPSRLLASQFDRSDQRMASRKQRAPIG